MRLVEREKTERQIGRSIGSEQVSKELKKELSKDIRARKIRTTHVRLRVTTNLHLNHTIQLKSQREPATVTTTSITQYTKRNNNFIQNKKSISINNNKINTQK